MKKNFIILGYRIFEVLITIFGLLFNLKVFEGSFRTMNLLYYTLQSNIIVLIVFIILLIHTMRNFGNPKLDVKLTKITYYSSVWITITMLVYWILLVPVLPSHIAFTPGNITLHLVTAMMMIFEFLYFGQSGKIIREDVFKTLYFPLIYFIVSLVGGFTNLFKFQFDDGTNITRFPYFFMDYDALGNMMIIYCLALLLCFIALGYVFKLLDKWLENKKIKSQ